MRWWSFVVALTAALGTPASAGDSSFQHSETISLQPNPGYFTEHCLRLDPGQRLEYRMRSPFHMDFNVHYHGPDKTAYPVAKQQARNQSGTFEAAGQGTHCFMWTNREKRDDAYEIELQYSIDPE